MIGRMLKKMFSGDEAEENVSEKVFGNVLKFRVGSKISLSTAYSVMINPETMFYAKYGGIDLDNIVVTTILSFDFDGTRIYRLYCVNPDCMIQIHESGEGLDIMLFMLSQETAIQSENEYNEWYVNDDSIMKSDSIEDDGYEFNKVFGPLKYTECLEANGTSVNRPTLLSKTMSLFDRKVGDEVEYVLFDAELDNWVVEGFIGLAIPEQEISIT